MPYRTEALWDQCSPLVGGLVLWLLQADRAVGAAALRVLQQRGRRMGRTMDTLKAGPGGSRRGGNAYRCRHDCPLCRGTGLVDLPPIEGHSGRVQGLCPEHPLSRIEDKAATGALAKQYCRWAEREV